MNACLPYEVKGFRQWDRVMMPDGVVGFVNGRRKTGSFSIADVNGKTIKGGITYKKLRTLSRATTLLTQIMEMA